MFTKISPIRSATGASGPPPSVSVPTISIVVASIAVQFSLSPLKTKTRFVVGSKRMASGFCCFVSIVLITASVFMSKTVTLPSFPLLVNPRERSDARAIP